jgi:hypothetical protein
MLSFGLACEAKLTAFHCRLDLSSSRPVTWSGITQNIVEFAGRILQSHIDAESECLVRVSEVSLKREIVEEVMLPKSPRLERQSPLEESSVHSCP